MSKQGTEPDLMPRYEIMPDGRIKVYTPEEWLERWRTMNPQERAEVSKVLKLMWDRGLRE